MSISLAPDLFIKSMVEAYKPLFDTLSDSEARTVKGVNGGYDTYTKTFTLCSGPSESVNSAVHGKILIKSRFLLAFELSAIEQEVFTDLRFIFFNEKNGIEDSESLPIMMPVSDVIENFRIEMGYWKIDKKGIDIGEAIITQIKVVLDGIGAEYRNQIMAKI